MVLNDMDSWIFNDSIKMCRILWCRMGGLLIETIQFIGDWKWGDESLNSSKRWKMGLNWYNYPTTFLGEWGVLMMMMVIMLMVVCVPLYCKADSNQHNLIAASTMKRLINILVCDYAIKHKTEK